MFMNKISYGLLGCSLVCLAAEPTLDTSDMIDARGEHVFTVTNKYSQPLTGIVVRVDRNPGSFKDVGRYFYDSVMNSQPALDTDQSYTFHLGSDKGDAQPMRIFVETAIFADGSALGEPAAIQSLWRRREFGFAELKEALDLADRSMTNSSDRSSAIKALTELKESRLNDRTRSIEERHAVDVAFSTVIGNLRDAASDVFADSIIASIRKKETDRETVFRKQVVPMQVSPQ